MDIKSQIQEYIYYHFIFIKFKNRKIYSFGNQESDGSWEIVTRIGPKEASGVLTNLWFLDLGAKYKDALRL